MVDSFFIFGAEYLFLLSLVIALWFFSEQPREMQKRIALCAVIVLPVTYILAVGAGALYYNAPPFVVDNFIPLIPQDVENGFPSDHTLLAAAIAGVVWIYSRRLGCLLWILALLVGISRVYVGVHHFADILASIVIAFTVATIVENIFREKLKTETYRNPAT